jgi:uncharacterized protein YjaG (DUF416 family)
MHKKNSLYLKSLIINISESHQDVQTRAVKIGCSLKAINNVWSVGWRIFKVVKEAKDRSVVQ